MNSLEFDRANFHPCYQQNNPDIRPTMFTDLTIESQQTIRDKRFPTLTLS